VGVARQYSTPQTKDLSAEIPGCGQLAKQEKCRAGESVSLATEEARISAAYCLYLPESWAYDEELRQQAGVPHEIKFQTKPEIALGQIRSLVNKGMPRGVVLADAAYGRDSGFRPSLREEVRRLSSSGEKQNRLNSQNTFMWITCRVA
jgi:SRSO17 transposase